MKASEQDLLVASLILARLHYRKNPRTGDAAILKLAVGYMRLTENDLTTQLNESAMGLSHEELNRLSESSQSGPLFSKLQAAWEEEKSRKPVPRCWCGYPLALAHDHARTLYPLKTTTRL